MGLRDIWIVFVKVIVSVLFAGVFYFVWIALFLTILDIGVRLSIVIPSLLKHRAFEIPGPPNHLLQRTANAAAELCRQAL